MNDYPGTVYTGHTRSLTKLYQLRAQGWGRCMVDRTPDPYPGEPWFLDNGAFSAWRNGTAYPWERFRAQLHRAAELARGGNGPAFVVIPDLPAQGPESLALSLEWVRWWREGPQQSHDPQGWAYGPQASALPLYLAVQDGLEPAELDQLQDPETGEPWLGQIAGLFIGGTSAWKVATAHAWRELATRWGLKLHYARAGTLSKLEHARTVGADSIDSAFPLWTEARFLAFSQTVANGPAQLPLFPR